MGGWAALIFLLQDGGPVWTQIDGWQSIPCSGTSSPFDGCDSILVGDDSNPFSIDSDNSLLTN